MNWSAGRRAGKLARNRLSYANVASTLAIFIALGGSSYAAMSLSANSVGAAQIRSGAVGSSEIRNGSIQPADLSGMLERRLALALVPQRLGTTPFVPPRGNNACVRWAPKDPACVDIYGDTKTLGELDAGAWTLDCPPGSTFKLASSGSTLGFPVPAYTIDTTATTYTGASFENIVSPGEAYFTASNWTSHKHDFTPHAACIK